ncbi:MAG: HAD-IC family P-type ATPase [Chloroflexi bacterium]|nr:HAD-IC family P-type ATPase [Chloroflexota bacterium]
MTQANDKRPWHALPVEEVMDVLEVTDSGLTTEEARARLERFGLNELEEKAQRTWVKVLVGQFTSPLIIMLLVAAAISLLLGEWIEATVILAVVLISGVVGFIQETKAEQAIRALKAMAAPHASVRRDGQPQEIASSEVAPGDIILLEAGDKVPADARLIEAASLRTNEAPLTGESEPVAKTTGPLPEDVTLAETTNMVRAGTVVTYGRGVGVVVATGMRTEMGRIATAVTEVEKEDTPLQKRMAELTRTLGIIAIFISSGIFIGGLLRGIDLLDMFLFAVAAAVAAVPEGLAAIVTIVLALGTRRMAQRHVIIRKLPAVETLGSATVICTDKTGTLTRNEMTVRRLFVDGRLIDVTGEGYAPQGEFRIDGHTLDPRREQDLLVALRIAVLANDAYLAPHDGTYTVIGDPTEGALVVAGAKAGLHREHVEDVWRRSAEIPFHSELGFMATVDSEVTEPDSRAVVHLKGVPEVVLSMCNHILVNGHVRDLQDEEKRAILEVKREMADDALRVLALAYKVLPDHATPISPDTIGDNLVFVGLVGMIDPPRTEVRQAIEATKQAGIKVIMITGDDKVTATAIGRQLGLPVRMVMTGSELARIDDHALDRLVEDVSVFARVEPQQKLRIVRALKNRGEIVAMTGDGVNDAPALKLADIGVAMGITGTDVAREEADMILTDDNFVSIVSAIEEGRVIFGNIRRVVFYLLSTNVGEVLTLVVGLIIGLPLPLIAVQVLFINLVTDSFYDIALGVEPGHPSVLRQPPRSPSERIIGGRILYRFAFVAIFMTVGTLGLFVYYLQTGSLFEARTVAFTTMAMFQWFNAFNARSTTDSLFVLGLFSNRWLLLSVAITATLQGLVIYLPLFQTVFETVPLGLNDWVAIVAVSISVLVAEEIRKLVAPRLFG